jgi:GT2 family glycosyltransferase
VRVPGQPAASIVIPTHSRPDYLEVTLASVAPQAAAAGAEVIVINDGDTLASARIAERHGARVVGLAPPGGANAARNAGIRAASSDLIVLIDDDVQAPEGWLDALLAGARSAAEADVFGGPIRVRLEGGGPRSCGREGPPITSLDLGSEDRDVEMVWSANMAIRRRAIERIGLFDETLRGRGEEEEWERRYRACGGVVRYVAQAGLDHRRTSGDATLLRLSRVGYGHGRNARSYDVRKGMAPSPATELRTLAGCVWHIARRRCANGVVLAAHSAGRVREMLKRPGPATNPVAADDFLSGTSGQVWGHRATARAIAADAACDLAALATGIPWRLARAAAAWPRRRVLVLAIERSDVLNILPAARGELLRSRHDVRFVCTDAGSRGKFENLNELLAANPAGGYDWLLVVDDDVALPPGFLDAFVFLAERFDLTLAQPAHRWRSHAAYSVTRRRPASVVRETGFTEIGPLSALRATTFDALLPFPALRAGWGLDLHWSALAREHGWRQGVVDATPMQHGLRQIATSYSRDAAVAEAREFLAEHRYLPAAEANRTVATHRSWR